MVTSSIAEKIVGHLHAEGKKVLSPRQAPRAYIRKVTAPTCLLWNASCVVHEEFKAQQLEELRLKHPARRCSCTRVARERDRDGRRRGLHHGHDPGRERLGAKEYIVATDGGINPPDEEAPARRDLHRGAHPGKGATCQSCAHCPGWP